MSVSDVTSAQNTALTTGTKTTQSKSQVLGQDAFLKLLITQLRNQNPLEPMKDTEFIAQMAQFSALEQISQLREEVEGLRDRIAAINLLGKNVKANVEDSIVEGIVESVKNLNGIPVLVVAEQEISLTDVIEVLTP